MQKVLSTESPPFVVVSSSSPHSFRSFLHRAQRKLRYLYYKDYYAKRILDSPPVECDSSVPLEVHMVTHESAMLESLWCLKTFYHFSEIRPKLFIHDDGSLSEESTSIFLNHFKEARVIGKLEADLKMQEYLKDYEFSHMYRFANYGAHSLKLLDFYRFSDNKPVLGLDSDVLFFQKPLELLNCAQTQQGFYMCDYRDSYSLPTNQLENNFQLKIVPRVNTGIFYFLQDRYYDRVLIEQWLKLAYQHQYPYKQWTEQTAFAILFSKYRTNFKSASHLYQISSEPLSDQTVSHHFVNDGSRRFLYIDGLRYLNNKLVNW